MTWITVVSSSLSLVALIISSYALVAVRRSSGTATLKRLSEHSISLEELTLQLRNLRARLNMQAYRGRQNGKSSESPTSDAPVEDPADWKRRMNLQLALGKAPK